MKKTKRPKSYLLIVALLVLLYPQMGVTHCDMINGPVVTDAKKALQQKDITPLMKWISSDDEEELKEVFQNTLDVRTLNSQAQDLADRYFFETAVRLHRASENAPYTGLKPASHQVPISVQKADQSLHNNSIQPVKTLILDAANKGIEKRFQLVSQLQKQADQSVEKGREYVKAYVDYIHYVKDLYQQIQSSSSHANHELTLDSDHSQHVVQQKESPKDILEKEHALTLKIIDAAKKEGEKIQHNEQIDLKRVQNMLTFFINFVDKCHHAKEESFYFNNAIKYDSNQVKYLVKDLENEHDTGKKLLQNISLILEKDNQNKTDFELISKNLIAYSNLIQSHIDKENKQLFPIANKIIPQQQQEEIIQGFTKIEHEELGEGFHEKYHQLALEILGK